MIDKHSLYPLILQNENVPRIWGGDVLGAPVNGIPIGECWLESSLHDRESVVSNGIFAGLTLADLYRQHRSLIFGDNEIRHSLPLVKLIDTALPLSVQVHPDDSFAREHGEPNGKCELWYILATAADQNTGVYIGFRESCNVQELRSAINSGKLPTLLRYYPVQSGELYYVPSGTVHAIGAGITLLEIQQPSDTTYRLYDWERKDASGYPRPLHIELGCAATHFAMEDNCGLVTSGRQNSWFCKPPFVLNRYTLPSKPESIKIDKHNDVRTLIATQNFRIKAVHSAQLFDIEVAPFQAVLIPAQLDSYQLLGESGVEILEFWLS